jgi:hypothetical protein
MVISYTAAGRLARSRAVSLNWLSSMSGAISGT